MSFNWLSAQASPYLSLTLGLPGYLSLLVYVALTLGLVARYSKDALKLPPRHYAIWAALLVATPVLSQVLLLQVGFPASFLTASIPLLGFATTVFAAAWGGPLAGLTVGFADGLSLALFNSHRATQPFEVALSGVAIGLLVAQSYPGRIALWLRQPLFAALIGGILVGWPLQLLGAFTTDFSSPLDSLDRAAAQFVPTLVTSLLMSGMAGLLAQIISMRWRGFRTTAAIETSVAPWQQQLSKRIFFTFLPLALLAVFILVSSVALTSYVLATNLVVEQMSRNAVNASSGIPFFVQEGRSLIRILAQDDRLTSPDPASRQARLRDSLRSVAFFQQLILFDTNSGPSGAYPETDLNSLNLSSDEQNRLKLALEGGIPTEVITYEGSHTTVSFIASLSDPTTGKIQGALLGRTRMQDNPVLAPVIGALKQGVIGAGEGFIIDSQNRILLYPAKPDQEQQTFNLGSAVEIPSSRSEGRAFRQIQPDGSRRLVYIFPISGQSDWSVVIVEPNQVALTLAVQIALPTLLLLLVMIAIAVPAVIGLTRSITGPLDELVKSVDLIAQEQLDRPVRVGGEDEIGRLGSAFEQLRLRLKNRLAEQDRLLQISRAVSSNLELFRAMPPILGSALDVTQGASVRVALRRDNAPLQTYTAGDTTAGMASLDEALINLVEKEGTIVISQIARASASLNTAALPSTVRSLVALPLRSERAFYGVIWLIYDHEHSFEQSELTFLATLAGQAAVAVANSRLLAEAEEGRRKLEAVLESITDGLIAVDNQGSILLMNPAAEKHFGVRFEQVRGRPAQEIIDIPQLATILTNPQEPAVSLELSGRNGAILLANTSTMVGHDGALTGRVTLLRDISALKELDNIKTVFLRMVSHDLRSPLTYMRGYLSMLPISGDLNEVQRDSITKINTGIQHISEMTERLLYLSRLQFGDGAELELSLVDVKDLLDEINAEQSGAAKDKSISVEMAVAEKLPLLLVDGMLIHQAVGNLVSNAIKYTPEGGQVSVRAYSESPDSIKVTVADNGIGIRPEDQSRLFEAFYRVPQREGEPPRPQGTGLGLALVKAITDAHHGSVRVESALGKGSQFTLTFPVRKPDDF